MINLIIFLIESYNAVINRMFTRKKILGKEILGYHVDMKIGSGGFGTVYKVSKANVSRTYVRALKHIMLPKEKQACIIMVIESFLLGFVRGNIILT